MPRGAGVPWRFRLVLGPETRRRRSNSKAHGIEIFVAISGLRENIKHIGRRFVVSTT